MFEALMEFFLKIFGGNWRYSQHYDILVSVDSNGNALYTKDIPISIFGVNTNLGNYLSYIASLVSIIFIVVLCCLFVYKIIKLIGGLIR